MKGKEREVGWKGKGNYTLILKTELLFEELFRTPPFFQCILLYACSFLTQMCFFLLSCSLVPEKRGGDARKGGKVDRRQRREGFSRVRE